MTDNQFTALHFMLTSIADELSAIRGLLEKQQAPGQGLETVKAQADELKAMADAVLGKAKEQS